MITANVYVLSFPRFPFLFIILCFPLFPFLIVLTLGYCMSLIIFNAPPPPHTPKRPKRKKKKNHRTPKRKKGKILKFKTRQAKYFNQSRCLIFKLKS